MANYDLDIQKYHETHTNMWLALTLVSAAGYRYCDTTSADEHTVTVKDGSNGPSCVLYLRKSDLYLVGFKNAADHVFAFDDQAPSSFGTRLSMPVNYANVSGSAKGSAIKRKTIVDAITAFSGHVGTKNWGGLSLPFLAMALLVSEAMRFKPIFMTMRGIVNDESNAKFTAFKAWEEDVTSWNRKTEDLRERKKLKERPSQLEVKTWHHFGR
ncbi:ribosome-inactivating family protein [Sorangium sp. So ce1036]|uniref:ribosome-inactivating family protein n=1 Tax=Sorangium sp. So ce1036 TaxID=3133328 RepID=UPI003EFD35BD